MQPLKQTFRQIPTPASHQLFLSGSQARIDSQDGTVPLKLRLGRLSHDV